MNMINIISNINDFSLYVFSINNKKGNWFDNLSVSIKRVGEESTKHLNRYITYFKFNLTTFLKLLMLKPKAILYYETLSCFPVYLYLKIYRSTKVFIHYHEYISPIEKQNSSLYFKYLVTCEKSVLYNSNWISHTNKERNLLFRSEVRNLNTSILRVLPNYPPSSWSSRNANYIPQSDNIVKIIYVGSLDIETMYLKEFAEWVISMEGYIKWDIYSNQLSNDVTSYITSLKTTYIELKNSVSYFQLPEILVKYDIGVVLYKGHVPNYIYNVPNKIYEYLVCGLGVICPSKMKSVIDFKNRHQSLNIEIIDFSKRQQIDKKLVNQLKMNKHRITTIFVAEDCYSAIIKEIKNAYH